MCVGTILLFLATSECYNLIEIENARSTSGGAVKGIEVAQQGRSA